MDFLDSIYYLMFNYYSILYSGGHFSKTTCTICRAHVSLKIQVVIYYIMVFAQEEFLARAREIHGDNFDYTDTVYVKMSSAVDIGCRRCERTIRQTPKSHIRSGCNKCGVNARLSQEDFLARARAIHGGKFDYTDTVYVNMRSHFLSKCRRCERTFLQAPKHHMTHGCGKCRNIMSQETFIMKAKSVHGERYSYNDTVYIDASTKLEFGCDDFGHGTFQQSPGAHLSGSGCPKCMNEIESIVFEKLFYSEYDVGKSTTVLINNEVEFRYDIVINVTDKNGEIIKVVVETDGTQHFKKGITLEETQRNDQVKPSKCVFYVFITSVYAHAFNSIDFPVTSH